MKYMEDIFVNYKVVLSVSGNVTQEDITCIEKIAKRIGGLFGHECTLKEIQSNQQIFEVKNVWRFTGDEGWLCQMNPVKLFKDFKGKACKEYLEAIDVKDISDTFIEKVLAKEIQIEEHISF